MDGPDMFDRPLKLPDFVGAVVILGASFLLAAGLFMPRMVCVMFGMRLFWNQATSPEIIQMTLYEGTEFIFALITGMLAMSACRTLVPGAGLAQAGVLTAIVCLIYGIITMLLQGRLPAFFFPTYLDLAADLPGWLMGYYLAGGQGARQEMGLALPGALAGGSAVIITLAVLQPAYFPFYTPAPVYVSQSFHSVPVPPEPADQAGEQEPATQFVTPSFHSVPVPQPGSSDDQPVYVAPTAAPYVPPSLTPPPITPNSQTTPIQDPSQN